MITIITREIVLCGTKPISTNLGQFLPNFYKVDQISNTFRFEQFRPIFDKCLTNFHEGSTNFDHVRSFLTNFNCQLLPEWGNIGSVKDTCHKTSYPVFGSISAGDNFVFQKASIQGQSFHSQLPHDSQKLTPSCVHTHRIHRMVIP